MQLYFGVDGFEVLGMVLLKLAGFRCWTMLLDNALEKSTGGVTLKFYMFFD